MFRYELWFEGNCLTETDYEYETYWEAEEEASLDIEGRIDDWKANDAYNGETENDFEVIIFSWE